MNEQKDIITGNPALQEDSSENRLQKLQNNLAGIQEQIAQKKGRKKSVKIPVVLIVDEDPEVQKTVKSFFGLHNISTRAVGNGLEAINMFHNSSFNLIITALFIPGINGNIIARYVKQHTESVPVIAMTESVWMAEDHFDTVLEKPLNLDVLLQKVLFHISKHPDAAQIQ
ncbi:MAG: CheY-like chemotaxis protein [Desulforhopalus sp.]|jgi:CheY-like chemotaxis protein